MRVVVASSLEALSQFANAINTVKMAQGFARLGHNVSLICTRPLSGHASPTRLAEIYGLTEKMHWIQLPSRRLIGSDWLLGLLAWRSAVQLQPEFVYSRHYIFPCISSRHGIATAGESHAHVGNQKRAFRTFLRGARQPAFKLLVTISRRLAEHYHERGVPLEKLIVLESGVDLQLFQRPINRPPSPLSTPRPNAVYSGHLYEYNGIHTVIEAAQLLPDVSFHFVGGWPRHVRRQKRRAHEMGLDNVNFHGLVPQSVVPPFLWHGDVLLLPLSQRYPNAAWASPVKMGEYLASGTPIVATSTIALRELLAGEEVAFVEPDNPAALAEGIQRVLSDGAYAARLTARASIRAQHMSYERRAQTILQRCGFG